MKSTSPSPLEEGEERAAGFVLFRTSSNATREFLLLQHHHGGHWAFPKGRVEPGERDEITAIREVMEETGISQLQPIPGFLETSHYVFERHGTRIAKTVVYYLGRTEEPTIDLSEEHDAYRWLPAREAADLLTYDEARRILKLAEQVLDSREEAS